MSHRLVKILQGIGLAVALAILILSIRAAWREISGTDVPFDPVRGLASLLLLAITYLGFAALWREVAETVGVRVSYGATVQIWSFSNLGRYIPGKVWQVVGIIVVARDLGVPPGLAATVSVISLGFMIASGAFVALVLLPVTVMSSGYGPIVALAAVSLAIPVVSPAFVSRLLRSLPASLGCATVPFLARRAMFRLALFFCALWLSHGITFLAFVSAFGGVGWRELPKLTGAFSLAYVGGLAALFAPGGIGVREGILGYLLQNVVPSSLPAHVVAVGARIWTMCGEVLVLLLAVFLRARSIR